ncbi:LpqB [Microbacterium esteraromaticum]|uniref:LpqB n=1 Tax=Microbacterium esteraromaticum TaxID=57043 RepID=A0A1R4JGK2_9MICO|nr:LpqB family beta-propeller domain-containing protein [Microbacterium esteraromaticum]SJN30903.1 LpqB [Microbacterium esteraromaticum]
MRVARSIRLAAAAAMVLLLTACTGLPTSGSPNAGLQIGEESDPVDFTPIAKAPLPGGSPEEIVAGFLEASITPAGNWEIAQEFLTDDFAHVWNPNVGVAIDDSVLNREFASSADPEDESATSADVRVQWNQIASIDADGAYSAASGTAKAVYRVVREPGGEWRISKAKDGIVLDADNLNQVYRKYSLKYFDQSWTHLVPDVRWFPRRVAMATTITRAVLSGEPSGWLAPAVRTAFPPDVVLVGDAVPVDPSQVASVSLSRTALAASGSVLARMRTQLEASLAGAGVAEVRFTVDGAPLLAETVKVDEAIVDPGVLVLDDEMFGAASAGGDIMPVTGLTAQIAKISNPISAIDVSIDGTLAAVQLADGGVWAVKDGNSDELDSRPGLVSPTLDPFGFTWTVPRDDPQALSAWDSQVVQHEVADAWPDAGSVSHLRVSADGARVAAVVTRGGHRRLVIAAILRDENSVPVGLGDIYEIARLDGAAQGLAWVGSDSLAVLSAAPDPVLTTYIVGGPSTSSPAPAGATALAGAKTTTGLRVLASDGSVYALRGSSWQVSISDILVLGTRAGY